MSKILVAYFSASGVTARAAKVVADKVGGNLFEIKPAVPYTKADLDWHDKNSRSSVEMGDKSSRPAVLEKCSDIEDYNTVFLGFPIWWYVAPTLINTFLESYDFSGKRIVLFATSGGSGFGKTVDELKESVSADTIIEEGKVFRGNVDEARISEWIGSLEF